jgi:hypothetical protein
MEVVYSNTTIFQGVMAKEKSRPKAALEEMGWWVNVLRSSIIPVVLHCRSGSRSHPGIRSVHPLLEWWNSHCFGG